MSLPERTRAAEHSGGVGSTGGASSSSITRPPSALSTSTKAHSILARRCPAVGALPHQHPMGPFAAAPASATRRRCFSTRRNGLLFALSPLPPECRMVQLATRRSSCRMQGSSCPLAHPRFQTCSGLLPQSGDRPGSRRWHPCRRRIRHNTGEHEPMTPKSRGGHSVATTQQPRGGRRSLRSEVGHGSGCRQRPMPGVPNDHSPRPRGRTMRRSSPYLPRVWPAVTDNDRPPTSSRSFSRHSILCFSRSNWLRTGRGSRNPRPMDPRLSGYPPCLVIPH